ncbi:amidohydrolase family protein [soil metagenome]
MRQRLKIARALLAAIAALGLLPATHFCAAENSVEGPQRPILAIESVALVDVVQGRIVGPRTVLIRDGRIVAIEDPSATMLPPAAVRVDGRGHYLMLGLVDMHVHLFNNATDRPPNDWSFPLFVANGVTAVREMAARPADMPMVAEWRAALERGDLIAPRVLAAGVPIRGDSPEAVRRQVREIQAAGADFVKVFSDVGERQWRAALEETRAKGMPLCGHIPADVSLLTAADAGQRSNEHLMQVYEASSAKEHQFLAARQRLDRHHVVKLRDEQEPAVLDSFDPAVCKRAAAALVRSGQVQVPTLVMPHFESQRKNPGYRDDPRWPFLRSDEQARWERILGLAHDEQLAARRWEVSREIVKALHAVGVPILAGTDTPMPLNYPGYSLHTELELLVESGLTPAEALRAATLGPAEFLGIDEGSGSIAPGKRADLLLLEANPLRDIRNTQRIRAVVLNGRLLQRTDLDALLNRGPK